MANMMINLAEGKVVYLPGEMVCGTVTIMNNSPMDVKGIEVKFIGSAQVSWEESTGSGDDRRTDTYWAKELYFKNKIVVFHGDGASLPAGQHVFPFQYQLPLNLPSSFEVHEGYVRYTIKSTIKRSGIFSNYKSLCCYTVLSNLDLNQIPNMLQPVGMSDSKTLCCLCCADGPIEAEVSTDRSGYVPGEFITVNGNIENMSSEDIPTIRLSILQLVVLRATSGSKTLSLNHATVELPGCKQRSRIQLNNEKFQIPALPPTDLRFCSIIDINYFLQACVVIPGPHINLRINCPITLGSIPLQNVVPYGFAPPQAPQAPPQPELPSYNAEQPSAPQPPPPTYAAATAYSVRKPNDDGTTSGQETFAPQYAYYDWSQSAFSYN